LSTPSASEENDPSDEEGREAGKDCGANHECNQYRDCDGVRWRISRVVRHLGPLEAAKLSVVELCSRRQKRMTARGIRSGKERF